ncbi:MAG TPA: glycoside hydrolase family 30 beta sandwich domain-containing protein [Parafilimonas sp.]|nr:glycoside hydrolase family 30 beta sandwich domain-containing protein [Parafilimonas sp.]
MTIPIQLKAIAFSGLFFFIQSVSAQKNNLSVWLTNNDRSALFQQQASLAFGSANTNNETIVINDGRTFQRMDGFGFALTGGSAMHIIRMSAPARNKLLHQLFDTTANAIGVSYLRLSIGASDLNEKVFSYDDVAGDTTLSHFDLAEDKTDVIPVMKEILAINPHIEIVGSPWSPPAWMKTNNDTRGGRLKPEYYSVYAKYLAKYIESMKQNGITIDAITVQNEPLHPGNNPSLLLVAPEEADFIKYHLGPLFKTRNIKTKIIIYDHNADRPDYPISILDDAQAAKYIDGSGFHLYGGTIDALTDVHNTHPDKNIYFTEQMVVQFNETDEDAKKIDIVSPVNDLIIDAPCNWSKNVLLWNLAADPEYKPYTDRGGCPVCQGAVTINKDSVEYNLAYYAMAHASKFVRPGSVRIASTITGELNNVAFITPAKEKVLIVANTSDREQTFNISYHNKTTAAVLNPRSVATYIWK